jgi:hypothetical protein
MIGEHIISTNLVHNSPGVNLYTNYYCFYTIFSTKIKTIFVFLLKKA